MSEPGTPGANLTNHPHTTRFGNDWMFVKHNLAATAPPTVTDDSGQGYSATSVWWDVTNGIAYLCFSANLGAAVWVPVVAGAGLMSLGANTVIGAVSPGLPAALTPAEQAANILAAENAVAWQTPTLLNSWVNFPGLVPAGYRKDPATGLLYIRGTIENGTTSTSTALFNLPVGYRPTYRHDIAFLYVAAAVEYLGRIIVYPNGDVTLGVALTGADPTLFITLPAISLV